MSPHRVFSVRLSTCQHPKWTSVAQGASNLVPSGRQARQSPRQSCLASVAPLPACSRPRCRALGRVDTTAALPGAPPLPHQGLEQQSGSRGAGAPTTALSSQGPRGYRSGPGAPGPPWGVKGSAPERLPSLNRDCGQGLSLGPRPHFHACVGSSHSIYPERAPQPRVSAALTQG